MGMLKSAPGGDNGDNALKASRAYAGARNRASRKPVDGQLGGAPLPWYLAKTPATLREELLRFRQVLAPLDFFEQCAAESLRGRPVFHHLHFRPQIVRRLLAVESFVEQARKPRKIEQRMKLLVKDDELGLPPAFAFHNLVIARRFDPQPFLE